MDMDMMNLVRISKIPITSILTLVFLACVFKLINWAWFRPKKLEKFLRNQGLNGSPYKLLVGDVMQYLSATNAVKNRSIQFSDDLPSHFMPFYKQMTGKYGANSFVWLGSTPSMLVTDPQMIRDIFSKPDSFQMPTYSRIAETIVGGLVFLQGDKWARHRKILNPVFSIENLKNMTSSIQISCSDIVDKWEALICNGGNSNEIDVWPYLQQLTGDVISRTAFSSSYEHGRTIFELQKQQRTLLWQFALYCFIPGFRYLPSKASRTIKANSNQIKCILRDMINQREKEFEKGGNCFGNDLLGMLMESNYKEVQEHGNDKNMGMSIEDVTEECKLFYFAGSESTAALLVWTMILLSKHQEWQARAREEVMHVFGKKEATFDGLNRLKVVTMILQEVMRLYPPFPSTRRTSVKMAKLGNLTIPVGTHFFLLIGLLNHDPGIWGDDVEEFKPERFSEGISNATKAPFTYMPFSIGPRNCIGQNLVMIEAKMVVATILQRFRFELSSSYLHAPLEIITLQPRYGAPLHFHKI